MEFENQIVSSTESHFLSQPQSLWEKFAKDCKINNVSDQSLRTYQNAYKSFFEFLYSRNIKNPSADDVVSYREYLKESHQPTTVQLYITALRLIFKWTDRNHLYPNIADGIKGARLSRVPRKDYLSPEKVNQLLDSIGVVGGSETVDYRDYTMLALMTVCGLRDIEVANLNWGDLSLKGDSWVLYVKGKGRDEKEEFVVVPERLKKMLFDYKSSLQSVTDETPMFTSLSKHNNCGRLTTRSVSRICKTRLINAGLESSRLTAHSLRHTSITLALKGGVPLEEVQQHARHKNLATTLIYDHALKAEENKSTKATENAIFGKRIDNGRK